MLWGTDYHSFGHSIYEDVLKHLADKISDKIEIDAKKECFNLSNNCS